MLMCWRSLLAVAVIARCSQSPRLLFISEEGWCYKHGVNQLRSGLKLKSLVFTHFLRFPELDL